VRSETASGVADFKGVIPMLYGRARVDLPFSGFWLSAEGQGIGYDGHKLIDANAHLGWESAIGLGVEAGWRMTELKLDTIDDLDSANIRIQGPYVALNFHF
jgi:outer membrane protein